MVNAREVDLFDDGVVDGFALVLHRDGRGFVHLLDLEGLVGGGRWFVTALRAGDAFDQLEGLEALHLVADRPRVAVDLFGDVLAFDGVFGLLVEVRERAEDFLLARREFD